MTANAEHAQLLSTQLMGTSEPSAVLSPMASQEPMERSSELAFAQPGHWSAMVAVTTRPLFKLVTVTLWPHSEDA